MKEKRKIGVRLLRIKNRIGGVAAWLMVRSDLPFKKFFSKALSFLICCLHGVKQWHGLQYLKIQELEEARGF